MTERCAISPASFGEKHREANVTTQHASQGSLLSSQDDSEAEKDVKAHDFAEQQPVKRRVGRPRKDAAPAKSTAKGKGKQVKKAETPSEDEEAAEVVQPDDEGSAPLEAKKEDEEGEADADAKQQEQQAEPDRTMQPRLVTGATMKSYQVSGMEWLISLYENGLNGILADEMGLGKTLQTIAFLAYLREKGVWGPFLVCCPLSTLANWVNEFERFTPDIPVILYHGTPQERATLRAERMSPPTNEKVKNVKNKKGAKAKGAGTFSNTTATFPVVVTS
jgi:ATP-dependent DNA helicase